MARIAQGTVKADADFGEGYWTDHWSYGLDLIEDFLRIWPEREQELMQMELPWSGSSRELEALIDAIVRLYPGVENCGSITFWKRDREKNGAGMGTGIW